jgi:hypothetical protein
MNGSSYQRQAVDAGPDRRVARFTPLLLAAVLGSFPVKAGAPPFRSPALPHITSWLGNTYPGAKRWVQQDIRAMTVTEDGTVFTNVEWEEGGGNVGEYRDGALRRYAMHTHGWGANGGLSVAVNSNYLFIGLVMGNEGGGLRDERTWPPKGMKWFGVSRRWRSDISKAAPFAEGKGGKGDTLKGSFLVVAEAPEKGGTPLAGMVATETELFASDPNSSEVKVFDSEAMTLARRWPVERAGPLAMDRWGNLALLQAGAEGTPARVLCYGLHGGNGKALRQATLPREVMPSAICFRDNRLLVADVGPAQQILVFAPVPDAREMRLEGRFGEPGGLLAATGMVGDQRFNDVRALGCDGRRNIYIAQNGQTGGGGTVLESYALASGRLNWRLFGLTFVDMADVDPASDTDVFTKEEHFRLDYSQPAGREWSYAGYTVNRFKYPQDPRLHIWSAGGWVRRVGGRRILFVNDMNGEHLQVYRFASATDGETAIPAGFFAKRHVTDKKDPHWPPHQPEKGEWIWRDANGNGAFDADEFSQRASGQGSESLAQPGARWDAPPSQGWWVDAQGNVWLATETHGLRFFPAQELDAKGNPAWNYNTMLTFPPPAEFKQVKRVRYLPESDTLFLAGTTGEHKNQHWKPCGPVLARYDGWLNGGRKLRWTMVVPYASGSQGHSSCEPMGFDVAGQFVFVPYTGASKADGVKHGRVEVFRASDGASAGHLEPSKDVGEIGLQDIRECLAAHRRADGEFLVFLEDDYKSKVVMYRLPAGSLK